MTIKTKFDIGQKIYIVETNSVLNRNCPTCKGEGRVEAIVVGSNDIINCKCSKCNGTGNVHSKDGTKWSSKKQKKVLDTMYVGTTMISRDGDIVKAEYFITGINIDENINIRYLYKGVSLENEKVKNGYSYGLKEEDIFETLEEAQKYCEDFNSKQEFD